MKKFAAKLLWQFRSQKNETSKKMRVVEEQIIVFSSVNADKAYIKAQKHGESSQYVSVLDSRRKIDVHYEFIGVVDLIELDDWDDDEAIQEVWSELSDKLTPMERRDKLIPPKEKVRVFHTGNKPFKGRAKLTW